MSDINSAILSLDKVGPLCVYGLYTVEKLYGGGSCSGSVEFNKLLVFDGSSASFCSWWRRESCGDIMNQSKLSTGLYGNCRVNIWYVGMKWYCMQVDWESFEGKHASQ